jgi:excisionase family DNA binding protein
MDNEEQKSDYMTIEEVAKFANVSDSTVRNWIKQEVNPLPCYRLSRQLVRIKQNELIKWLEAYQKTQEELDQK